MLTLFLAQLPAPPARAFDIADGFAVALILMLFLVLGCVAWMARSFRRREKEVASKRADNRLEDEEPSMPSSRKASSTGSQKEPWERDPDWWRGEE